ncbi:flagellar M-ring protein FliF [Aliishimia ponticola]|uniref:Flagellar M-ring protein n=1 Tax=Aliishimia ponticola TaxID=2499833 RepID=A0A4S4N9X3_9RHOB|nr:flagellar basal-body MS-ring/collar protein FliF [Aliishimia ponticola]THH34801.1 flagellar M-ring protein FliF [Aliishimia ponticola]
MQQLLNVWMGLSPGRRVITVGATLGIFFAILAMTRIVSAPTMSLLYAGLEPSAAGEVVRSLEARGMNYDIRGGSIFVETRQRDELRMTLASEGLPANSSGGYELLDSLNGFGTTSQMFDAAYWRAKEGELARTIVAAPHISSARVHIANGGSNPFQRGVTPTASVAVNPVGGELSAAQAKSLKFLVASAVAGLSPEDVAVIGANGALFGNTEEDAPGDTAEDRSDRLKQKVERLLEARVGPGNAIVEVSVDTVTESEEIRERRFDPEGRVAISTDTEEVSNASSQAAQGQVTVASNLPDGDAAGGDGSSSQNSQTRERVNYEVSETEREIVRAPGAIKRLTVAVLVNGTQVENAAGEIENEPRSEEEMAALRELVESAVGFDETRGDVITIKSMGLLAVAPMGTEATSSLFDGVALDLMSVIQMAVLALVTLILGLFVVRPLLSGGAQAETSETLALPAEAGGSDEGLNLPSLDGQIDEPAGSLPPLDFGGGAGTLPELPMMGGDASGNPADRLRNMIEERQTETVEILRNWLEDKEEVA